MTSFSGRDHSEVSGRPLRGLQLKFRLQLIKRKEHTGAKTSEIDKTDQSTKRYKNNTMNI